MQKRIYKVTDNSTTPPGVKLVRAGTQAQAIRAVVGDRFTAEKASQDDLVAILSAEDANTVIEAGGDNGD